MVLKAIMLRRLVPADLLMPMEVHEVKGDFLYPWVPTPSNLCNTDDE